MQQDLNIDYTQTRNLGNNVISKGGEFATLLGNIKSINENLRNYWKGKDAEKYTNAVLQQSQVMDKLNTTINEIGEFLINVANIYEEVSNTNQQGIKN